MSTQFDKELDRLFKDWGLENWSVKNEAKEAIKKAVEVHIIGEYEAHIIASTGVAIDSCDSYKTQSEADCNCPAGERNQLRKELKEIIK